MSFPTDFPKTAAATLLGFANGNHPDTATAVLAGYELEGYILGLIYKDAKYPVGVDLGKLIELAASPEFASAKEALAAYQTSVAGGTRPFRALLQILLQYGPQILGLLLKLLALAK